MNSIDFDHTLARAKAMTEDRLRKFPAYGVFVHASEQLALMQRVLTAARAPTQAERDALDIGLMAAKELEAQDPEYAEVLMLLEYEFKRMSRASRSSTS
jgi:hypothetical protein